MKNKFKIVIAALILLGLAYLLPIRSDAGINDVKQSLGKNKIYNNGFKKDSAPTKPDNVAPLKKESKKTPAQTSFKPNIEFWKKQLKISKKKQVPKQALKPEKGQQLKRISEPLAQPPQRIKDAGFPDLSHNDNAEENEVKDAVSAIKNAVYGYDAETALNLMGQTHDLYSKFPKWAALVRFLLAELISRVILSVYDTKRVLDLESYRQIIDIYSSYKGTDSVYDYIISQSLDRLERWKPMQNQYETGCVDAYKQIAERIQIIEDLKKDHTVNEGPPADVSFDIEYSALVTNYMSLTDTLLVLRDDEGAYNSMREMEKVFKSIPDQITVNYEEYQNGNSWEPIIKKTKTYQITKETTRYLTSVKNYAQTFAILGGLDYRNEPSNYYKPEIIKAVNEINDYKITSHDNITPEILEGFKKELDSYDKESEISKITFATNEGIEILPEMIVDPAEIINVRGTTDMTGVLYSQKVSVKSNISKREKNLTLKSDMFYVGLFKNFTPNATNDPKEDALINDVPNAQQQSISVFNGYLDSPDGLMLYNCNYFKTQLVHTNRKVEVVNPTNNEAPNFKNFVISGGAEFLVVDTVKNIGGAVLLKNQADWFIIEGDGIFGSKDISELGAIECVAPKDQPNIIIKPEFLVESYNGLKSDVDVLVLDSCHCLKWHRSNLDLRYTKKWQKVLPNGLILGYGDVTKSYITKRIFEIFKERIKPDMDNKMIGQQWLQAHVDLVNENDYPEIYKASYLGDYTLNAAYIIDKKRYLIELRVAKSALSKIQFEMVPDKYDEIGE